MQKMDIGNIIIIIVLVLVIVSQFVQMKRTKEINERLKKIVSHSNEQYQDVVEINKNLKHIRHDINKQKAIAREIEEGKPVESKTGVEVIDRILHFKGYEMLEKGIRFSVETISVTDLNIGQGALISILTNIFDNAIEACEGLNNPWISCVVIADNEYSLHMKVENSKSNQIKLNPNYIETTKQDKELHGYGVEIIRELIEKNKGKLTIEDKGDVFSLEFML
ncbi:MAG: GHKL domain-containing protein [Lachnospiraceae bacterium]|nr:GHKL domain-containing protein [Lachnospiraceae bacterium]